MSLHSTKLMLYSIFIKCSLADHCARRLTLPSSMIDFGSQIGCTQGTHVLRLSHKIRLSYVNPLYVVNAQIVQVTDFSGSVK